MTQSLFAIYLGRGMRDMGRGLIAIFIAIYLTAIGLSMPQVGLLLTLSLLGGFLLSLVAMSGARYLPRKIWFVCLTFVTCIAGCILFLSDNIWLLAIGSFLGSYAASGMHWGPTVQLEQVSVTEITSEKNRPRAFSNLNIASAAGRAIGSSLVGIATYLIGVHDWSITDAYKVLIFIYVGINVINGIIYLFLTKEIEPNIPKSELIVNPIITKSRRKILKLSGLFGLDSFAGGLIFDSFVAFWLFQKFGMNEGLIGIIFISTQMCNLLSLWLSPYVARKIGLLNTIVWTQVIASLSLMFFALAGSPILAVTLWMFRGLFDEMDVPARQSYMMVIIPENERNVMAGTANLGRGVGRLPSSYITGLLWSGSLTIFPFMSAGILKLLYDFTIYRTFHKEKPVTIKPKHTT